MPRSTVLFVTIASVVLNVLLSIKILNDRDELYFERGRIVVYMNKFSFVIKAAGCVHAEEITRSGAIFPAIKYEDGFADMSIDSESGLRYIFDNKGCLAKISAIPEVAHQ